MTKGKRSSRVNQRLKEIKKMKNSNTNTQNKNIIKLIKANVGKVWVDDGNYPHYTKKLGKLSNGVEIVALENGKPSTIEQQADPTLNNYLVIFVDKKTQQANRGKIYFSYRFGTFLYLTKWEGMRAKSLQWTTRGKSGNACRLGEVYRCSDAETLRKIGNKFFLLKVAPQYNEQDKQKQKERQENWRNYSTNEKAKLQELNIRTDRQPTDIERQGGGRFVAYTSHWHYNHSYLLDACYNDLTANREILKSRTQQLHEQRQLTEWRNQDHTDTVRELAQMCDTFAHTITDILNAKKYDFYARAIISNLMESIEHAQETIKRVNSGEIKTTDQLNERIKTDKLNAKKCRLIATKQGDPKLYGWCWWEDDPKTGGLVNEYKLNDDPENEYYHFINAHGVASY